MADKEDDESMGPMIWVVLLACITIYWIYTKFFRSRSVPASPPTNQPQTSTSNNFSNKQQSVPSNLNSSSSEVKKSTREIPETKDKRQREEVEKEERRKKVLSRYENLSTTPSQLSSSISPPSSTTSSQFSSQLSPPQLSPTQQLSTSQSPTQLSPTSELSPPQLSPTSQLSTHSTQNSQTTTTNSTKSTPVNSAINSDSKKNSEITGGIPSNSTSPTNTTSPDSTTKVVHSLSKEDAEAFLLASIFNFSDNTPNLAGDMLDALLIERLEDISDDSVAIQFLIYSYKRCDDTSVYRSPTLRRSKISDSEIESLRLQAQRSVVSMLGLRLADCRKWGNGIHPFITFVIPSDHVSAVTPISGTHLLRDLVAQFKDNQLEDIFLPIISQLFLKCRQTTVMKPYLEYLKAFSLLFEFLPITELVQKHMMRIMPNSPSVIYYLPQPGMTGRMIQGGTLLGALFTFSPFRSPEVGDSYFPESRILVQTVETAFKSIRTAQKCTVNNLVHIMMSTLKPESTRKLGITWISRVLRANKQRAQMMHVMLPDFHRTTSTDGFMINLCHVLLLVCRPFTESKTVEAQLSKIKISALKSEEYEFDITDETTLSSGSTDSTNDTTTTTTTIPTAGTAPNPITSSSTSSTLSSIETSPVTFSPTSSITSSVEITPTTSSTTSSITTSVEAAPVTFYSTTSSITSSSETTPVTFSSTTSSITSSSETTPVTFSSTTSSITSSSETTPVTTTNTTTTETQNTSSTSSTTINPSSTTTPITSSSTPNTSSSSTMNPSSSSTPNTSSSTPNTSSSTMNPSSSSTPNTSSSSTMNPSSSSIPNTSSSSSMNPSSSSTPTSSTLNTSSSTMNNIDTMPITTSSASLSFSTTSEPSRQSFVSTTFFIAHTALHLGYISTIQYVTRFLQQLSRLSQQIQLLSSRPSILSQQQLPILKQRMTMMIKEKLTMDAVMMDREILSDILSFYSFTCVWLSSLIESSKNNETSAKSDLQHVPEFFVEDMTIFLTYLFRAANHTGVRLCATVPLHTENIVTFLVKFVGNGKLVKNPYLRSKLVEVMYLFTPIGFGDEESESGSKSHISSVPAGISSDIFLNNEYAKKNLIPALIQLYVDIEVTGRHAQFYEKFMVRRQIALLLKFLREFPEFRKSFIETSKDENLFLYFINMIINDTIFLLDEVLIKIKKIHEIEELIANQEEWMKLNPQERQEREQEYHNDEGFAMTFCRLANETVYLLHYLSGCGIKVFMRSDIVGRLAVMLNYFMMHLVGKKSKQFKVKGQDKYNFQPKTLLSVMVQIYINFYNQNQSAFIPAIEGDSRSFSIGMFQEAHNIIRKRNLVPNEISSKFGIVVNALEECMNNRAEDELATGDFPEEFMDPLVATLMRDPVVLPTSGMTVDRPVIERHLLSNPTDPFNRKPLSLEILKPNLELKGKIEEWIKKAKEERAKSKQQKKQKEQQEVHVEGTSHTTTTTSEKETTTTEETKTTTSFKHSENM